VNECFYTETKGPLGLASANPHWKCQGSPRTVQKEVPQPRVHLSRSWTFSPCQHLVLR
jgi:hypothetical protein